MSAETMHTAAARWLAALLCLAMPALAGCGKGGAEAPAARPPVAGVEAYAPKEGTTYSISFVAYQLAPIDENAEMLKHWNEVFNVRLELWNVDPNQWDEILNLEFAAGEVPDLIRVTSMQNLDAYWRQDLLAEIPDAVLAAYAPGICQKLEAEYPGILRYGYEEGKRYGIPSEVRLANIYRAPLVYRGDWLSKLKIKKVPETLAEFEKAMYAFARNDPDGDGRTDTYGLSKDGMAAVFGAHGVIFANNWERKLGFWLKKDGKLACSSVEPGFKEALRLLARWYADGVLDPEFITGENAGGLWSLSHAFINGRIGFTTHGAYYHWIPAIGSIYIPPYNTGELYKKDKTAARSLAFGMPLAGPTGTSGIQQQNLFPGGYAAFGTQLEQAPDKMGKILQMIDWLCATSAENFATAWYGIPGKHFKWNIWGTPEPEKKYQDARELAKIGAHTIMLPIMIMEYLKEGEEKNKNPDVLLYKKWVRDNRFTEGGVVDELVVTTPALNRYEAELVKLQAEALISIITGDKPIDYFDTYAAEWRNAGGARVESEVNAWYATVK